MRGQDSLLLRLLQVLAGAALVLSAAAAVLPGTPGRVAGAAMLAVLVGAPLVRVARIGWVWARAGDRRHALLAALLLVIVLTGAALAAAGVV
jgi:hypothetical protein